MYGEIGDEGFLKIDGGENRQTVASILLANGYTVSVVRRKKNGKTYEYMIKYKMEEKDVE